MISTVNNSTPSALPGIERSAQAGRLTPWLVLGLWLTTMTCALGWFNSQQTLAWCRAPAVGANGVKAARPIDATSPGSP